ncbi:VOC family protein [Marinomonas sp. PE14-40]|uniref:VOC family protein n=1 Tax=Marinomonas sp. PE14-40 TaxID=3060621 RepID=UPI003F679AA9
MKYTLYCHRIFCFNFEQSIAFYADTLGLSLKSVDDEFGWAEFSLPGGTLAIEQQDPNDEEAHSLVGRFLGISLQVDNLDEVYAELISKGVNFQGSPEKQEWGASLAHFKDPDGNVLTLLG